MVGVYDPVSFLNGFIDPNSQVFAPYNTDKPEYVPRGIDPNSGAVDQGPPVYTLGSVTAGTTVTAGTGIVATAGQIRANAVTSLSSTSPATLDASLGQVFTLTPTGALTINATNDLAGSIIFLRILTSGASSYTITFGTNFVANGTLATGTVTAKTFLLEFVSDGSNFIEISRTTALPP
jgi:hypothetical protein